jgi:hypothetical protein
MSRNKSASLTELVEEQDRRDLKIQGYVAKALKLLESNRRIQRIANVNVKERYISFSNAKGNLLFSMGIEFSPDNQPLSDDDEKWYTEEIVRQLQQKLNQDR